MKKHKNRSSSPWMGIVITLAGALSWVGSAHGQAVTGDATLDNINPAYSTYYTSWNAAPTSISDGASGLTIYGSNNGGSLYYNAAGAGQNPTLNLNDNQATLVLTVNSPGDPSLSASQYWLGIPFALNDNSGVSSYGGYAGEFGYNGTQSPGTATWVGDTVTETVPLDAAQLAAIAAGGDTIYGFNLEYYPAVMPAGPPFSSMTFDSLTLSQAVPEPSVLALLGSGAAVLLSLRRRNG